MGSSIDSKKVFRVYDSHTAGTPTRVLLDDVPILRGRSMTEKKLYFQEHYDYIRTTLTQEPRGNSGILAVLLPPSNPALADFGVIFCDYRGYVDMCIHGTIGIVTTLIERSLTEKENIVFETPAGLVSSRANLSSEASNRVRSVTVSNVPAFFVRDISIDFGSSTIEASIAFGGNFYAYVRANDLKINLEPANIKEILSTARKLLKELKHVQVSHPRISSIKGIIGVSFYNQLGRTHAKNIMVAENDLFDRSPCGTGTCGRMAIMHSKGELAMGEVFRNRSIIDTEFIGKITSEDKTQPNAFLPEVTGTAYLTGVADFMISDGDNLGTGFIVA